MMMDAWRGHKLRLRSIEPEDWQYFYAWNFDAELARAVDRIWPPRSAASSRQWTEELSKETFRDGDYRWIIEAADGSVAGSIITFDCDHRTGTLKYAVSITTPRRGEGLGSEAVALLLRYYFFELGYQKANALIYSFNEGSVRFHERLGFQREGRLRRMVYTGGEYHDELQYGITREEFAATPCYHALPMV